VIWRGATGARERTRDALEAAVVLAARLRLIRTRARTHIHERDREREREREIRSTLQSSATMIAGLIIHAIRFVFIFSERELRFTFAICCRPSVCRLSVGNARAPYSLQAVVIFGNISTAFVTLAIP